MRRGLIEQADARQDVAHEITARVMLENVGAALFGDAQEGVAVPQGALDGLGQATRLGAIVEAVDAGLERPETLDGGRVDQWHGMEHEGFVMPVTVPPLALGRPDEP